MNNTQVPVLIQQLKENALDAKIPEHIRYNYMLSLENIRDYCDKALNDCHNNKPRR